MSLLPRASTPRIQRQADECDCGGRCPRCSRSAPQLQAMGTTAGSVERFRSQADQIAELIGGSFGRSRASTRRDVAGIPTADDKPTVCACDCESYCQDIAEHYVKEHLRYPVWFGGKGTPIKVEFVSSECFYMPDGGIEPCNWGCRAEFKRSDNGAKVVVNVTLMNSQRFFVGTEDPAFPLCAYDFECDPFTLSEAGCEDRTTQTPPPAQTVYFVQPGDYLAKIANDHGVALGSLQQVNPQLGPPYRSWNDIYPGDAVNIPA